MERTIGADATPPRDDPLVAPAPPPVGDAAGDAAAAEPGPDQGWMLTAVLVGLIVLLALCAALALVAWDRAPVGAAG